MGSQPINISASRAAAVLGLSPWATGADVQREILSPSDEPREVSAAAVLGSLAEDAILAWSGVLPETREQAHASQDGVLTCHLDGLDADCCVVEAKTTAVWTWRREWGEPGTESIPVWYRVQVQQQLGLTGRERARVVVATWPDSPESVLGRLEGASDDEIRDTIRAMARLGLVHEYSIRHDPDLWEDMQARLRSWWWQHIVQREPIAAPESPRDLLARLPRPCGELELDDDEAAVVYEWIDAAESATRASELRSQVLDLIAHGDPVETGADRLHLIHGDVGTLATWDGRTLRRSR